LALPLTRTRCPPPAGLRLLQDLRRDLLDPTSTGEDKEVVQAAA
jgi:hypothetical protein